VVIEKERNTITLRPCVRSASPLAWCGCMCLARDTRRFHLHTRPSQCLRVVSTIALARSALPTHPNFRDLEYVPRGPVATRRSRESTFTEHACFTTIINSVRTTYDYHLRHTGVCLRKREYGIGGFGSLTHSRSAQSCSLKSALHCVALLGWQQQQASY
jgi:hypothetical protein